MLIADSAPLLAALLLALLLDWLLGDPPWLWRRLPHPVVVIGRAVDRLDARWNEPAATDAARGQRGALAVGLITVGAAAVGWLIQAALLGLGFGWLVLGVIMSTLLAHRSLVRHVGAVADGLEIGLGEGRAAVAHIVGRDPASLDRPAVARAAIESAAENFADGVVAPLLYGLLFGLPGMLAYKALNTLDSMIGHRSPRHRDFGRFAARLDDLANLPAARAAAVILVATALFERGANPAGAVRAIRRDARSHRSPNAGWPEAAMAGALGLRLAGPRRYAGELVEDAWMGDGRAGAAPADIRRAIRLLERAFLILLVLVLLLGLS